MHLLSKVSGFEGKPRLFRHKLWYDMKAFHKGNPEASLINPEELISMRAQGWETWPPANTSRRPLFPIAAKRWMTSGTERESVECGFSPLPNGPEN